MKKKTEEKIDRSKQEKVDRPWPVLKIETRYHIFEMTEEGHLRKPKGASYSGDEFVFDGYNGYDTFEEATQAILDHDKESQYSYGKDYIVLPVVKTIRF